DDAPPGYSGVATLLASARIEARTVTSAPAEATIAAMVAAVRAHTVVGAPRGRLTNVRLTKVRHTKVRHMKLKVATAASAGLLAFSGAAVAGALPSAAQQHVSTALAKLGIEVPKGGGTHGRSPS